MMKSIGIQRNFRRWCKILLVFFLFFIFLNFECFAETNQELCEKEIQTAKESTDFVTCLEHLKKAMIYFNLTKHTVLEKADFNYSLTSIITRETKKNGLTEEQKKNIAKEAIPYFEESKNQYKEYIVANKKVFEEFMDMVNDDSRDININSKKIKESIKTIYAPFVSAEMRYFECVVEKLNLMPKDDPSRFTGLDKIIDEADELGYLVEAPVPIATIGVSVGRIFSILSESSENANENKEKALEKFKEVLATEKPSNQSDAEIIREIKAKAINGMIELALRSLDYSSALEAIELYTNPKNSIMPINYQLGLEEFDILLHAILINAHASVKIKSDKDPNTYLQNIKNLKSHLEKAIPLSTAPEFWQKKLNSYLSESDKIMGKK